MSNIKVIRALTLVLLSLPMVGCDKTVDSAKYHREAIEAIEAEQFEDSLIHLKMALKGEPSNAELRRLMGQVWFHLGDLHACLDQLDKAKSLGHNVNELVLPYARCHLYQKNNEALQALAFEGTLYKVSSANMAQLFAYKALGEMEKKHFDQALDLIDQAKTIQATHPLVILAQAQWLAYQKEQEEALEVVDNLLEKNPKYSMAWGLKGDLHRLDGQSEKALKAYSQAILYSKNRIDLMNYHMYRGLIHIYGDDMQSAKHDIQWLEKYFPKSHGVYYLQGLSALTQHQYAISIESFQKALQLNPSIVYAHYFLGLSYFLSDSFQNARDHLTRYTHAQPKNLLGQKLLVLTEMKLNDYNNAKMRLSQLIALYPNDAHLYQLLGEVFIKEGDIAKGSHWLEKAMELQPNDVKNTFKFGITQMDLGDVHSARWAFDQVLKKQPKSRQALLLKFINEFKSQNYVLAQDLADRFVKEFPDEPIGYNLKGMVYLAQKQTHEAQTNFDAALKLDAHDPNAHTHLAYMAMKQKNIALAKNHYDLILKQYEHVPTLLKYAKLSLMYQQDSSTAQTMLKRAIKANPLELQGYLALARLYMAQGHDDEAQALLRECPKPLKTHPDYLALEGLILLGQDQQFTARKHWLMIAKESKQVYASPLTFEFGMALAQKLNDWSQVIPYLDRVRKELPSSRGARTYSIALQHNGQVQESVEVLDDWLAKHPHDSLTRLLQANTLLMLKQEKLAQQHYEVFVRSHPNHPVALNNLAWTLRDEKPDEALIYAQRAVELQPQWPSAQHTLQTIQSLLAKGSQDKKLS